MSHKKSKTAGKNTPQLLEEIWNIGFFKSAKSFDQVQKELERLGCNPQRSALQMALSRSSFLTKRGTKGTYTYIQRHAPSGVTLNKEVLPEHLLQSLAHEFSTELDDLKLNYGKSGICTAFLLRKLLEKLIFIAFAKHAFDDKLRDANGDLVGLKTMLKLAVVCKVNGKPFLMTKTAKEIEGIKFLGDTSAHNPLVNVDVRTIVPVMPFIITAYSELAKKL